MGCTLPGKKCTFDRFAPADLLAGVGDVELPQRTSTGTRWQKAGVKEGPWRASPATRPQLLAGILANMMPSSIVMRKDAFHRMGGFYAKTRCLFGEDTSLWIKLLLNYEVIFGLEPLVNRYCDASDLSVNWTGVRPVEPFLLDPEDVRADCPPELRNLLEGFLAIRAFRQAVGALSRILRRASARGNHAHIRRAGS
jgi:hypothetical protein